MNIKTHLEQIISQALVAAGAPEGSSAMVAISTSMTSSLIDAAPRVPMPPASDTAAARRLAGVEAVLTAQDIPGEKAIGIVVKNQAILAVDKVRYLGDGLAVVAARTREIAEAAVKLIQVDYEPLPVVSDPEAALAPDAPRKRVPPFLMIVGPV